MLNNNMWNECDSKQWGKIQCHLSGRQRRPKVPGQEITSLAFVEMLAGAARLAKIALDQGTGVLPVDKISERASQTFVANYDATNPEECQDLMALLEKEKDRLLAVHLAPTCCTASKAWKRNFGDLGTKGSRCLDFFGQKTSLWA